MEQKSAWNCKTSMRFHTTLNDITITFCTSKLLTVLLNVFTIKVKIYWDFEFEL
jgi:hypothetical protein